MSLTNADSLTRVHEYPTKHKKYSCNNWQQEYKNSITDLNDLCKALKLDREQLPVSTASHQQFKLRVPRSYVHRMQKSNPIDPLLLQVLPTTAEEKKVNGFTKDPVGDLQSIKSTGLLQKYKGRALLLTTSLCAIHCRYCFRKHFPYTSQNPRYDSWKQALHELENDHTINEVILSGGDPLALSDQELEHLVKNIENIQHIQRLRIHTRLPVVIPARICDELIGWIRNSRLKIVVVTHINHAQEIDHELANKIQALLSANCVLLNQSVLLKNVNDHASILVGLSEKLFNTGILPYYLHLLDKVEGAAHFEVSVEKAKKLMQEIAQLLPGYLVPKLVNEVHSESAKKLINY